MEDGFLTDPWYFSLWNMVPVSSMYNDIKELVEYDNIYTIIRHDDHIDDFLSNYLTISDNYF